MEGVLHINKPAGITSARAVARVKRLLPRGTKVGHAGTLDPFATGVLLVLIGKATKLCEQLMDQPKQYEATVKFGATTATDDIESPELPQIVSTEISREQVQAVLRNFVGEIMQRPPAFSAMKVGGRRSYDLARQGKAVELAARKVYVYGLEMIEYAWPILRLRIDCGRGTYVRAIARDVGQQLGVGGYLTQLCRTRVGKFELASALDLDSLSAGNVAEALAAVETVI